MNINKRKALPYVFALGIFILFILYITSNIEQYRNLFQFSNGLLLLLLFLIPMFILANGLINKILYESLGTYVGYWEGVALSVINTLANQLPFAGGLVAKGVYLKQRYNLKYTDFLSATAALFVFFMAANGIVGMSVLFFFFVSGQKVNLILFIAFLSMVLVIFLLWIPVDNINILTEKLQQRMKQATYGWRVLNRNIALSGSLVALQILNTFIFAARFWVVFHALSQDVTYAQCLLFSASTILTRLVSISPGGLGVREGIVAGIASILGFDPSISAVAVGLDRVVSMVVVLIAGTISAHFLGKNIVGQQDAGLEQVSKKKINLRI